MKLIVLIGSKESKSHVSKVQGRFIYVGNDDCIRVCRIEYM